MVNGSLTEKFPIQTGVKQGDPLSPLLFTLAVELLAKCANREDLKVHLPKLGNVLLGLLMYADDTCLASLSTIGLNIWVQCLETLAKATGLNINVKKTFIINDNMTDSDIKELMEEFFRYLGFAFDKNAIADGFKDQLEKVTKIISTCIAPKMNIHLKVTILKCYYLSKLWFQGFINGRSSEELEEACQNFLWTTTKGHKITKVSKKRAEQPMFKGGLGMWNLGERFTALKANLMDRIIHQKEMKLHHLVKPYCNNSNIEEMMMNNSSTIELSPLVDDLFQAWKKCAPGDPAFCYQYHTVKELQELLAEKRNHAPIYTKKHKSMMRYNIKPNTIFSNINKISNVTLRSFGWKFFQGALPFNHKEVCSCGEEINSHSHLFFKCKKTKFLRNQADRLMRMLYIHKLIKYEIPWNEQFFWSEWSQHVPRPPLIRCVMLCAMSAMWISIGTGFKTSITNNIELFVNAELAMARNIRKEEKRFSRITQIHKQWKLNSLWLSSTGFPSLKHKITKIINKNSMGNDPRIKLPFI